jgi:hypothetical protein
VGLINSIRLWGLWLCGVTLVACGGGSSGGNELFAPGGVEVSAQNGEMTLTWDAVTDATAYTVYYASEPGIDPLHYAALNDSGIVENATSPTVITPPDLNEPYWLVVTSLRGERESPPGQEVATIPRYNVPTSAPETVEDLVTGLTWMRCSRGQTYNQSSNTCQGDAISADLADNRAETPSGWSIPSEEELQSIVLCRYTEGAYFEDTIDDGEFLCPEGNNTPAVFVGIFPDTSTSSLYQTRTVVSGGLLSPNVYRLISMLNGDSSQSARDSDGVQAHVRFVK